MARFIHFMPMDSPVFNSEAIRLINGIGKDDEHLFLLASRTMYDRLSTEYSNVVWEPRMRLSTLRKYDTGTDIFVLHSLFLRASELARMTHSRAERVVWCVWGHDLYAEWKHNTPLARLKGALATRVIGRFRAVAVGFKYDEQRVRQRFGDRVPIYNALYPSGYFRSDADRIYRETVRTDYRTNIMIGHSAFPFLKHIDLLERMVHYKEENFVITLILAYGESGYADQVVARAKALFPAEKLHIVRDFMDWEQYIRLLCGVDIAIFDYNHQAAFGNLILLSYLRKKLYLAPAGVMYKALCAEGAEVYSSDEIGQVPFSTLVARNANEGCSLYVESLLNKNNIAEQWRRLFQAVR